MDNEEVNPQQQVVVNQSETSGDSVVNEATPEVTVSVSGKDLLNGKVMFEFFPPKEMENSPNNFAQTLLALTHLKSQSLVDKIRGNVENITFELAVVESKIHFYGIVPEKIAGYFESQITASYPDAGVIRMEGDYLTGLDTPNAVLAELALSAPHYLPLRTYKKDEETDPLSAVLGTMARVPEADSVVFQLNLGNGGNWQRIGRGVIQRGVPGEEEGQVKPHPYASLIEEKISQNGFDASMRIFSASPDAYRAGATIANIANAFGGYSLGEGNSLKLRKTSAIGRAGKMKGAFFKRSLHPHDKHQFLNIDEVATIFHFPGGVVAQTPTLKRVGSKKSEAPSNLPI